MRCIRGELSRLNWGHPRKNPSKKFGCDTSCKFVTRLGKDLQYSPSLVPACTWSRSNFSDEVFFLGCRNLWMVCVKIRRCIKGEESSPPLQPRRGFRAPPLRVLRRRTRKTMQGECRSHARMAMAEPQGFL